MDEQDQTTDADRSDCSGWGEPDPVEMRWPVRVLGLIGLIGLILFLAWIGQ